MVENFKSALNTGEYIADITCKAFATCHNDQISTLLDVILVSNPRRFLDVINEHFDLSDHHNFIGAATRRHAPSRKSKKIYYSFIVRRFEILSITMLLSK